MHKQQGFTLLEVIVAMTVIALALGTTLGLLTNSKRLAFKAADKIEEGLFLRAYVNLAQALEEPYEIEKYPEYPETLAKNIELRLGELSPELQAQQEKLEEEDSEAAIIELEDGMIMSPDRQTRDLQIGLEPYLLIDEERGITISSVRWKKVESLQ